MQPLIRNFLEKIWKGLKKLHWVEFKYQGGCHVFKNPTNENQLYIFPELLADKVEHGPHAARFFSGRNTGSEPVQALFHGFTANTQGHSGSSDFICHV